MRGQKRILARESGGSGGLNKSSSPYFQKRPACLRSCLCRCTLFSDVSAKDSSLEEGYAEMLVSFPQEAPSPESEPRALVAKDCGSGSALPPPVGDLSAPLIGTAAVALGFCLYIGVISTALDLPFFPAGLCLLSSGIVLFLKGAAILAKAGESPIEFCARETRLPPDWHNLHDPRTGRTFYYNTAARSARWNPPVLLTAPSKPPSRFGTWGIILSYALHGLWQQIRTLVPPVITTGLYFSGLRTITWCARFAFSQPSVTREFSIAVSAILLALPPPLGFLVIQLNTNGILLSSPGARARVHLIETALCIALPLSLLPSLRALLESLHRAARARLPYCNLDWDARAFAHLMCALCPALSWRTRPSALALDFSRVVLFPLPFGAILPLPVPRLELLGRSLTGLLFAATMVLPLAELVAKAMCTEPVIMSTLWAAIWRSQAVRIGVCVSVVELLITRQRVAYDAALKEAERSGEESYKIESHERKELEDFDRRLKEG